MDFLIAVLLHEIIDLTSLYDVEKDAPEVIALLCPPDIKRAKVEVFTLPTKIILGKDCIVMPHTSNFYFFYINTWLLSLLVELRHLDYCTS